MANEDNLSLLENKEIRGITLKQLLSLFVALGAILISVVITYSTIVNKLDRLDESVKQIRSSGEVTEQRLQNLRDNQENQYKSFDLQLKMLEIRLVKLEAQQLK